MELAETVAKNIRSLRKLAGLSQQQLSKRCGLSVRYLSRLENSSPNITLDVLSRLAKGLDCNAAQIVSTGAEKTNGSRQVDTRALANITEAMDLLKDAKERLS